MKSKEDKRREFIRRAAKTGLPVVLATVWGRRVNAQTPISSAGCSMDPSAGSCAPGDTAERRVDDLF